MNTNIYGDFQICISVPLNTSFIRAFLLYATTFLVLLFFGTNQSEGLGASVNNVPRHGNMSETKKCPNRY